MRTIAAILVLLATITAPRQSRVTAIPTPDSVFGFPPGADYKLATYDQSIAYFKKLAASSRSIKLFEAGRTTQGRTMYFALISAPENLAKIDRYREIWQRLAPSGFALAALGGLIAVETRSYAGWFLVSATVLLILVASVRHLDRPLRAMLSR